MDSALSRVQDKLRNDGALGWNGLCDVVPRRGLLRLQCHPEPGAPERVLDAAPDPGPDDPAARCDAAEALASDSYFGDSDAAAVKPRLREQRGARAFRTLQLRGSPPEPPEARCVPPATPELHAYADCLRDTHEFQAHKCDAERREAHAALQTDGYKPLGHGMYRQVYALGARCVLKVPVKADGARANRAEAGTWSRVRATRRRDVVGLFAPVATADPGGAWLAMARARVDWEGEDPEEAAIDFEGASARAGVRMDDLHGGNVGVLRNRLVAIDYGGHTAEEAVEIHGAPLTPRFERLPSSPTGDGDDDPDGLRDVLALNRAGGDGFKRP